MTVSHNTGSIRMGWCGRGGGWLGVGGVGGWWGGVGGAVLYNTDAFRLTFM